MTVGLAPVRLETERLRIRSLDVVDGAAMAKFHRDNRAHLERWEPPHPAEFYTEPFWSERCRLAQDERAQGSALRLIFEPRDPTRLPPLVGTANFTQIFRGPFCACVLGFSGDARAVGQGLMREGLAAAIEHVFDVVGLHRVQANHLPINERSSRLLRRLGFVVEGYARDYLFIDGAWRDHVLTAKTNPRAMVPA